MRFKDGILATIITAALIPTIWYTFTRRGLVAGQIFAIGIQLGAQCWVSGVAGVTMLYNLERAAFAQVQSALFPK